MKISIISFTLQGSRLSKKLQTELERLGHETRAFGMAIYAKECEIDPLTEALSVWTSRQFVEAEGLVFIGATGIAVRAIAPFVKDKTTDPAVIVLDEKAGFVIPLLSGHIGGANELAKDISNCLGSVLVLTTATDLNHKFAVDIFAKKNDLYISRMDYAKQISAAVLNDEPIGFESNFHCIGSIPNLLSKNIDCEYGIFISLNEEKRPFIKTLHLIPRIITLGVGCRKGKSLEELEAVILDALNRKNISIHAVEKLATIDLKKEEKGLLEFCKKYKLEMVTYTALSLEMVQGTFVESDYVKSVTGIGNVCERAARLGSEHGTILQNKIADSGVTVSLAMRDWSVKFE